MTSQGQAIHWAAANGRMDMLCLGYRCHQFPRRSISKWLMFQYFPSLNPSEICNSHRPWPYIICYFRSMIYHDLPLRNAVFLFFRWMVLSGLISWPWAPLRGLRTPQGFCGLDDRAGGWCACAMGASRGPKWETRVSDTLILWWCLIKIVEGSLR